MLLICPYKLAGCDVSVADNVIGYCRFSSSFLWTLLVHLWTFFSSSDGGAFLVTSGGFVMLLV